MPIITPNTSPGTHVLKKLKKALKDLVDQLQEENKTFAAQLAQFDIDLQKCCLAHQTGNVIGNTNTSDKAHMAQNVPNPFNQQTIIKYYLPKNSAQASRIIKETFDNLGNESALSETKNKVMNLAKEFPLYPEWN